MTVLERKLTADSGPRLHRWSHDEYDRLTQGGFFEDKRVQLIEGEIIETAPQRNDHAVAVELAADALREAFKSGYRVRVQLPMLIGQSQPEPDISVLAGKPRDSRSHPTTAVLVVEISDTTLHFDRQTKAAVYAAGGLGEYWIINLVDRCLEVHRDPVTGSGGAAYSLRQTLTTDDAVTPLAAPLASIPVRDLLP